MLLHPLVVDEHIPERLLQVFDHVHRNLAVGLVEVLAHVHRSAGIAESRASRSAALLPSRRLALLADELPKELLLDVVEAFVQLERPRTGVPPEDVVGNLNSGDK